MQIPFHTVRGPLERATLIVYEPPPGDGVLPGPEIRQIGLHFNPETLRITKSAGWVRDSSETAKEASEPHYSGPGPRCMDLEVFLDSGDGRTNKGVTSVTTLARYLLECCTPTARSAMTVPTPPWVRLSWGWQTTSSFYANVTNVDVTFTYFARNGTPLRAKCTVGLEEIGRTMPRTNPTSGGRSALSAHRVTAGQSLHQLAYDQYGDATQWRLIARENRIDDPARVPLGTPVLLPDPAEADGADHG